MLGSVIPPGPMRLVFPDPDFLSKAGYPSLAYCPFLIDEAGDYHDAASRYFRERALGEWVPKYRINRQDEDSSDLRFLTRASCEALGKRVRAFLTWCLREGKNWKSVDYTEDLIFGWQKGMLDGTASESGQRLSFKTINNRVSEAAYFLTWAYERGLREPFRALVTERALPASGSGKSSRSTKRVGTARVGSLPEPITRLLIPNPKDVGRWLAQVRILKGTVKALCCELVISTGVRLSECIQWRVQTLPPRTAWQLIDGNVVVEVRHGNKGRKIEPGSLESARPRDVLVPLDLAERIERYRTFQRPTQIRRWIRAGATKAERDRRARLGSPDQLWLGPRSNQPFSNSQLYQDWTSVPGCPQGWHPHVGREFFAVETLVAHTRSMLQTASATEVPSFDWLHVLMAGQVRIILQPLMGHVSEDTTNLYLKALRMRLVEEFGHPALRWQDFCDGES